MLLRNSNVHPSSAASELLRAWQIWSDLLEHYLRAPNESVISESVYRKHHRAVVAAINSCSEQNIEQALIERMHALADPWVTLNACREASDQIRANLIIHCHECEQLLGGRVHRKRTWRLPLLGAALVSAGLATVVMSFPVQVVTFFQRLEYLSYRIDASVRGAGVSELLVAGTAVMLFVGWWMLRGVRHT